MPDGEYATLLNPVTGQSVNVVIADGGFDPQALVAKVGDTLEVKTHSRSGVNSVDFGVVPRRRPPQIVRTEPPKGKTDVPLNTQIIIVFSEPVDPATVSGALRVFNGNAPVAGTVTLSESGIIADFAPDSPLVPNTTYDLVVDAGVRNLLGDSLGSEVHLSFTTGDQSSSTGGGPTEPPLTFESITEGFDYTCGLASGTAYCWGSNWSGQLGTGTGGDSYSPIAVTGGLHFTSLSAGAVQACGVTTSGDAYCWGNLGYGDQPLDAATLSACNVFWWCPRPVLVPGGVKFTAVSAGGTQRCGITSTGAAYCWGNGWGPDGFVGDPAFSSIPIAVPGNLTFATVSAGTNTDCGVTSSGDAYCWGRTFPDNGGPAGMSSLPVRVAGGLVFKTVVVSEVHACGLTTDGAAYCWGTNYDGALGDGTTTDALTPVKVAGNYTFATISIHRFATCGVTTDGLAYCWGTNSLGFGNYGFDGTLGPTPVAGGITFAMIGTGSDSHRCGISTTGTAYCWGSNINGELGDGTTRNSATPVKVLGQE